MPEFRGGVFNRRRVLTGLGTLAAMGLPLRAAVTATSPIAHGELADNALAKKFEPAPSELPDVMIRGPDSVQNLSAMLGRTILMPVWAEWCTPCLRELPDFALLQREYGSSKFAVIPVLSGPMHKVTPEIIGEIFARIGASTFQPLMEDRYGSRLLRTMARRNGEMAVPCNIIIAPNGEVVAREIGLENDDAAVKAGWQSAWGGRDGQELAAALAGGFLG